MRAVIIIINVVFLIHVNCQFWKFPKDIFNNFSWIRQGRTGNDKLTTVSPSTSITEIETKIIEREPSISTQHPRTTRITTRTNPAKITETRSIFRNHPVKMKQTTPIPSTMYRQTYTSPIWTTVVLTTQLATTARNSRTTTLDAITSTPTEYFTMQETTTQDTIGTTEESRDNHRVHDFYLSKREKPQVKISSNISQNLLPLPAGASAALVKPTKYHYYPHNQHIYLLPECAIQQVCNAVYIRLNWTQPLCACPSRYRDPCSASLNSDDQHTTELMTDPKRRKALTLVKTCEPTAEMRICRNPRDWSLLALQNVRTGKSHYLVICRCPETNILEGPMSHDQPTYASVPGIRVYGMICVQNLRNRGRFLRYTTHTENPTFPWDKVATFSKTAVWD